MRHKHDWHIASVKKGKTIYTTVNAGASTMSVATGKEPDVATYRCDCGEEKQEEMKSQWT